MTTRALSTVLAELKETLDLPSVTGNTPGRVSIDTLLLALHERGFGVVLLIFALPLAIPVPKPPGLSTILGIPLLILTLQQAVGRHTLWMPQVLRRRTLGIATLHSVLDYAIPISRKIESLFRPRLEWVTSGICSRMAGAIGVFVAIVVICPFPGMNTIPSFGVALMATGVMMRDGLAVLLGGIGALVWILCLGTLYIFFGWEGINALRSLF